MSSKPLESETPSISTASSLRQGEDEKQTERQMPIGRWVCQASSDGNGKKSPPLWSWLLRRLFLWLCSLVLMMGMFIAALPTLISTSIGLGAATMALNIMLPGLLEVRKVSAGWQRPLYVEGVVVKDGIKKLVPVLEIERVTTSKSLIDIIQGERFEVFVLGPTVNAFPDEVGTIPVVRFAQKTGLLLKQEKQVDMDIAATKSDKSAKDRSVVRTKHFEEWMANTTKKAKKDPKPMMRKFEQSHINMTAEIRLKGTSMLVNNGRILVTKEMRALVGDYMHWIVAHGQHDVEIICHDLNLSSDWTEVFNDMNIEDVEEEAAEPVLVNISSPNIWGDIRGWKVNQTLEMERPGKANITVTPAFARECLAALNPLLINMVAMKNGSKLGVDLTTQTMSLPAPVLDFHLQPVRLTTGATEFWDSLLNLLKLKERGLTPGQILQVWTSAIDCSVIDNEVVRCKRCDMLLGLPNKGVHIVVWGDCMLDSREVKMWLGIPSDTLFRIGYQNLKDDYVLPIPLRGTVDYPIVDWEGATEEIAKLAFSQLVGDVPDDEAEGFEGTWRTKLLTSAKKAVLQSKKKDPESAIPRQLNPLPWKNDSGH